METTQTLQHEKTQLPLNQAQAINTFCSHYTLEQAQQELWRWCILALKNNYDGLSSERTTNLITFYENLKTLVSAVYQLHDQYAQEASQTLNPGEPDFGISPAAGASLSAALDTLHTKLSHNWTLLICPPD